MDRAAYSAIASVRVIALVFLGNSVYVQCVLNLVTSQRNEPAKVWGRRINSIPGTSGAAGKAFVTSLFTSFAWYANIVCLIL